MELDSQPVNAQQAAEIAAREWLTALRKPNKLLKMKHDFISAFPEVGFDDAAVEHSIKVARIEVNMAQTDLINTLAQLPVRAAVRES